MLLLLAWVACTPAPDPATQARWAAVLSAPLAEGPLDLQRFSDRAHRLPGYTVTPVRYLLRPGFPVAAALYEPDRPTQAGVIVAQGHFGQGKSAPEAQEIAHRLAARGARVLSVDTPGVEEWEGVPGHDLHFEAGAHARAYLAAGGSSAMALQIAILRRGLDVLEGLGARRFGATGASGGAVQSAYLLISDPRLSTAVMASFPPLPREARPGGCPCDQLPGWPGPDPALLGLMTKPSLWLADGHDDRPPGLPRSARFERLESPHSYDRAMQDRALDHLDAALGLRAVQGEDRAPLLDLATPGPDGDPDAISIFDLPLQPGPGWAPAAAVGSGRLGVALTCQGAGPTWLLLGGDAAERAAVVGAGLRACDLVVTDDEVGLAEGIGTGHPYAGRLGLAVQEAARLQAAVGAVASGAWAVPAAASGLPFGVVRPLRRPGDRLPDRDPAWVHVPGIWWGGMDAVLAKARFVVADPAALALALAPSPAPAAP